MVLARLRIGHSRLTHGHLMEGREQPYCEECIVPLTVYHIVTDCPEYWAISEHFVQRRNAFRVDGVVNPLTLRRAVADDLTRVRQLFTFITAVDTAKSL